MVWWGGGLLWTAHRRRAPGGARTQASAQLLEKRLAAMTAALDHALAILPKRLQQAEEKEKEKEAKKKGKKKAGAPPKQPRTCGPLTIVGHADGIGHLHRA